MSYAGAFLKTQGTDISIQRATPVPSKVSMKRSTNSTSYLGAREAYYSGLVLADSDLKAGEVFSIGSDKYLVQTALKSFGDMEIEFMAAKTNAIVDIKRHTETVDQYGNFTQEWKDIGTNVDCFGEIVTYQTRQVDPGILEGTRYIFQISKNVGVILRDRIVYNSKNYDVISVDDTMEVFRLQLGVDTRED